MSQPIFKKRAALVIVAAVSLAGVHGQSTNGESCVQVPFESIDSVSTNSPNIASLAKAAALQGAAQWYEPADHGTCDRLPLRDFQNSVEVISACYFDDSERPDLADSFNGTFTTYVVNWNGTVPCSQENADKLREQAGGDIAFTLEFQTNFTVPGNTSEVPTATTKFVAPKNDVPPEVREFEASSKCPDGSTNVFLDDATAVKVADNAARAYYNPAEHGLCDNRPMDDFLTSVDITSACVSDSTGDYTVGFRGTIPCSAEGRAKVLQAAGPDTAFTFNFNATGSSNGDLLSAAITSGYDNTGVPTWPATPDTGSGTSSAEHMGVTLVTAASFAALALVWS